MGEQPANAVKAAEEKLHDEQLDWEDFCADKAELEEPVDESDRWVNIQRWVIEDLLDAARTEGRGDQEPVAWQEAAEPFFRLAREVINPVNGERPWHADSKDWMVVFSFAGQSVTLGDLRRAAVASPIREPEISREAVASLTSEQIARAIAASYGVDPDDDAPLSVMCTAENGPVPWWKVYQEQADAILNLAPVGGRGEVSASDRAFVRHLIREMRSAIADDPNDATITTGPLDPDILERLLNVALAASKPVGGRGEEGSARADLSPASRSPDQHSDGGLKP